MKVSWTADATEDRDGILDFLSVDDPRAALRMDEKFNAAARRLEQFPMMGRPGAISGTREFVVHPSFRLVYQIEGKEIRILALVHTARRWPPPDET